MNMLSGCRGAYFQLFFVSLALLISSSPFLYYQVSISSMSRSWEAYKRKINPPQTESSFEQRMEMAACAVPVVGTDIDNTYYQAYKSDGNSGFAPGERYSNDRFTNIYGK